MENLLEGEDWVEEIGQEYDEGPDPFHFQYGVHDDKYYTDTDTVWWWGW